MSRLYFDNASVLFSWSFDQTTFLFRVDQDFDQSRVPTLLDKLLPVGRPRPLTPDRIESANVKTSSGSSSTPVTSSSSATSTLAVTGPGRNRAVVDSDSEDNKSDTSIESESEEEEKSGSKKKAPLKKRRKVK